MFFHFTQFVILENLSVLNLTLSGVECYLTMLEINLFSAPLRDEEDEMLQLAIQQSLLEYQGDPAQLATLQALRESQHQSDDDLQRLG